VWKYGRQLDIQSPTAENMLGKKMKEEEEGAKYNGLPIIMV